MVPQALVERLLAARPEALSPLEAAIRVLLVLDQSVHAFESYEDFYRAGYTAADAVTALRRVGAAAAASALEPLLRTHDWQPSGEPDSDALTQGLDVYEAVAADIEAAIDCALAE